MDKYEDLEPPNKNQLKEEEDQPVMKRKKKKLTRAERMQLKLRKKRNFKMLEIRLQLKREYGMSKKTARKYRERWESMCREVKLKQMKQELQDWENQFNRLVKQKDGKIELLLDEIATTEDFRKKSFSTNLQMMDYLLDVLKTFQETSYLLYEKDASELLHDFYEEVDHRGRHENHLKLSCENVTQASEALAEQELLSDYKIFVEKRDDRVCEEIEKRYRVRDNVLKKMKCLREQLLEFLSSLMNTSLDAHKYEKINFLMERQRNFQVESNKLNKEEEHCKRVYEDLQQELRQEKKEAKRKLDDMQAEYDHFLRMRIKIENKIKLNRKETYEMLKLVGSESYKVKKEYQKLKKYGELLLSLAASCRKLQTESEKVLPAGDFQETKTENSCKEESFKLKVINLEKHVDQSEKELQSNARLMSNFWRRQALAEAQVLLLEEQKKKLLKENQQYIEKIKRLSKTDNVEDLKETLQIKPLKDFII